MSRSETGWVFPVRARRDPSAFLHEPHNSLLFSREPDLCAALREIDPRYYQILDAKPAQPSPTDLTELAAGEFAAWFREDA